MPFEHRRSVVPRLCPWVSVRCLTPDCWPCKQIGDREAWWSQAEGHVLLTFFSYHRVPDDPPALELLEQIFPEALEYMCLKRLENE